MLQHKRALIGSGNPIWLPTIGGVAPTIFADFAANNYWYKGNRFGTEAAWASAVSATFTRASTAYYTNSLGLLAGAGNNVLRFDYNPSTLAANGILLEGVSTNVALQSNTFSSTWLTTGTGSTILQNATDPAGVVNNAWTQKSGSAASTTGTYQAISGFTSASTASIYFKPGSATYVFFAVFNSAATASNGTFFTASSGAVSAQNVTLGGSPSWTLSGATTTAYANGYYRISINISAFPSGGLLEFGVSDSNSSRSANNGSTAIFAFTQLEALSFPSSYIPTTASTASRSADSFSIPYAASMGALAGTGLVKTINSNLAGSAFVGTDGAIWIRESNNTKPTTFNGSASLDGNTITSYLNAAKTVVAGSSVGRAIAANGNVALTDTNALAVGAVTKLYLGSYASLSNSAYTDLWQFGFWAGTVATSSQVQALSALP